VLALLAQGERTEHRNARALIVRETEKREDPDIHPAGIEFPPPD